MSSVQMLYDLSDDVAELGVQIGYARAQFDLLTIGYFNNKFPCNSPESDGYEAFATKNSRSGRPITTVLFQRKLEGASSC